jgi:predicted permease
LRRRRERELSDEIRAHLELLTEEHLRHGLDPEAARLAARRDFGGVEQVKETYRRQRGLPFADGLLHDVRYGVRLLIKDRWTTAVAATALALGIGASNTVFTFVNATRLRGLPVEDPHRLVSIHRVEAAGRPGRVSYRELETLRAEAASFDEIAGYQRSAVTVAGDGSAPEQIRSLYASENLFRLLRVAPSLGRDFVPEDVRPGAQPVAILGDAVFRNRFGGDRAILGSSIRLNGVETTIIGIMPEGFQFDYFADLWQPLTTIADLTGTKRDTAELSAIGRLAQGAELVHARAELEAIDERRRTALPEDIARLSRLSAAPFTGSISDDPIVPALLGAVFFLLLIACSNVANLLLARSTRRAREIGIRTAIGAARSRILRQLAVESALLAGLAAVAGLGISRLGVGLFARAVADVAKPYWIHWSMDGRVFLFFAGVSVATGILFGLAPALHLSGMNLRDLKASPAAGARRWTKGLLVVEVALTFALLAGAGVMLRSFFNLYRLDGQIETRSMTSMALRLPEGKYPEARDWIAFFGDLEKRLAGNGAISAVTTASTVPYAGAATRQLALEGREESSSIVSYLSIGTGYFDALRLRLLRGRDFNPIDGTAGQEAAIVNEVFSRVHFPNEDAIGKQIGLSEGATPFSWYTIVGIAPDVRQRTLSGPDPTVYLPYRADPQPFAVLLVRGTSGSGSSAGIVREEVRALDPELAVFAVMEMDVLLSQSRWPNRIFGVLFAVLAFIALALATLGLYAVVVQGVVQRVQEIGVRMAFGAEARHITWLVSRNVAFPLVLGLTLGLCGALAVGNVLKSFLVRTSPNDPRMLLGMAGFLFLVAIGSCWIPARRATRLDPVSALRHE